MGCAASSGNVAASTKTIDSMLQEEQRQKVLRLLLLGAGESGKSTILKQFRLANNKPYTDLELNQTKSTIYLNMFENCGTLVNYAREHPEYEADEELLSEFEAVSEEDELNPRLQHVQLASKIWQDLAIVRMRKEMKHELQLLDATKYYFGERIDDILKPSYLPSNQDLLQSRVRTVGVNEVEFAQGSTKILVIDVGGQRSERRKWVRHFDGVQAVIFLVALSGYAKSVLEDESTNQITESLNVFSDIIRENAFASTSMIIFMNKCDLFRKEIAVTPLTVCFPEYTGDPHEYDATSKYVTDKFRALNPTPDRELFIHITCAVDQNAMASTLNSIQATLTAKGMDDTF